MTNLRVDFKTFMEDENETTYELIYKREAYRSKNSKRMTILFGKWGWFYD